MTARPRRDRRPVFLAVLLFVGIVQGQMLSYNSSTKQIHFRCPRDQNEGDIMFIQLARVSPLPAMPLANWTSEHGPAGEETKLTIKQAEDPYKLEAIMNHVTCKDSAQYLCYVQRDSNIRGVYEVKEFETFEYEGEVTEPVTEKRPLKPRYQPKEVVTFTCKALIGNENNTFVWESRLPGENFTVVREKAGSPCIKINQSKDQKVTCDWEAETSLEQQLSADDDGREWRCRLQQTNHNAVITVAVECRDEEGCTVPCKNRDMKHEVTTAEMAGVPQVQVIKESGASQDRLQVAASTNLKNEESAGMSPGGWMLVLTIILPVCATIAFIAAVIACRHTRNKQVPPLVVMESPPPTEYGGSLVDSKYTLSPLPSRCSRRLPDLPVSPVSQRDSHTTTSTTTTTYTTANDYTDDEDTLMKKISPYDKGDHSRPSSSVYVRMSAVNLAAAESAEQGGGNGIHGMTVEGEVGHMRIERADSVYSNEEIFQAERARANSADGGSVAARGHATFRKELM